MLNSVCTSGELPAYDMVELFEPWIQFASMSGILNSCLLQVLCNLFSPNKQAGFFSWKKLIDDFYLYQYPYSHANKHICQRKRVFTGHNILFALLFVILIIILPSKLSIENLEEYWVTFPSISNEGSKKMVMNDLEMKNSNSIQTFRALIW